MEKEEDLYITNILHLKTNIDFALHNTQNQNRNMHIGISKYQFTIKNKQTNYDIKFKLLYLNGYDHTARAPGAATDHEGQAARLTGPAACVIS